MPNPEDYEKDPIGAFTTDVFHLIITLLIVWLIGLVASFVLGLVSGGVEQALVYALKYVVFMSQ